MKKRGKKEIKVKKTIINKPKSNHKNIYLIFFLIGLAGLIISAIKKNIIGIIINIGITLFSIIEEKISKKVRNYQKIQEANIHTLLLTLGLITGLFGFYKKDWLIVSLGGFIFLLSFAIKTKREVPKEKSINQSIQKRKQIKTKEKIKKESGFSNYYLLLILLIIANIFGLVKKQPIINLISLFIAVMAIILLVRKIKTKKNKNINRETSKPSIIKKQKRSPLLFLLFLVGCGLFYYSKIVPNQIIRLTSITLILLTIILFFIRRKKIKKQELEEKKEIKKKGPRNFIYFLICSVILIITIYYSYNSKWIPTLIGIYLFFFLILIYKIIQKKSAKIPEIKKKKIPTIVKEALYKTDIDLLLDLVEKNEQISISEASKKLQVNKKVIEKWARILEENNLLKITYPAIGEPILEKWEE